MIIVQIRNNENNYCKGPYYFIADSVTEAFEMAKEYAKEHNANQNGSGQPCNDNYKIVFNELSKVVVFDIKKGPLKIGRV